MVNGKEQSHGWESHIIEYFSVGTAVTAGAPATDDMPSLPAPAMSLDVNG